jgi:nudix-type nucleoside diphosphatase (YffH/AdpP family)
MFFYGTLCHLPLLEMVLGHKADTSAAILPDHASYLVKDRNFPMIQAEVGAEAEGLFVQNLSEQDVSALNFYEGGFFYDLKPVSVRLASGEIRTTEVYFPAPGLWDPGPRWDLAKWSAEWGDVIVEAASEIMCYHGRLKAEYVAERSTPIAIRANARLAARARPMAAEHDLAKDVVVHNHHHAHLGFFSTEEMDLQFRRYDGTMSPVVNRSGLMVGAVAVVLPYDPIRDEVLLIEQFRAAPFMAGEQQPWMWEPVSGLIDPGETPEQTAEREAHEEAGVKIQQMEHVARAYSSSGNSGDLRHIFIGLCDLSHVGPGGGLMSEGEDIRSQIIGFDDLMAGVDGHAYMSQPLITAALWLSRHRDRLRIETPGTA